MSAPAANVAGMGEQSVKIELELSPIEFEHLAVNGLYPHSGMKPTVWPEDRFEAWETREPFTPGPEWNKADWYNSLTEFFMARAYLKARGIPHQCAYDTYEVGDDGELRDDLWCIFMTLPDDEIPEVVHRVQVSNQAAAEPEPVSADELPPIIRRFSAPTVVKMPGVDEELVATVVSYDPVDSTDVNDVLVLDEAAVVSLLTQFSGDPHDEVADVLGGLESTHIVTHWGWTPDDEHEGEEFLHLVLYGTQEMHIPAFHAVAAVRMLNEVLHAQGHAELDSGVEGL